MAMKNYKQIVKKADVKYGIELEYTGITREKSAQVLSTAFQCSYNHTRLHGLDTYLLSNGWKIVSDGSIDGGYSQECELVTDILTEAQFTLVEVAVKALKRAGAVVNDSCGIHVHVSCKGYMNAQVFKKLLQHDLTRHDLIWLACRGKNNWCLEQNEAFVRNVSKTAFTIAEVKEQWYQVYRDGYRSWDEHYHSSRYHGLNLHSYFTGKGIEFRYFESTLDIDKVKAFVELSQGLLMDAINSQYMRQYIYLDRLPYDTDYNGYTKEAREEYIYKYAGLWEEYLNRMQISQKSKNVLLLNY